MSVKGVSILPTININGQACTGCGACVTNCPTDVLTLNNETHKAQVAYLEDCEACFICVLDCPYEAVSVKMSRWFEK